MILSPVVSRKNTWYRFLALGLVPGIVASIALIGGALLLRYHEDMALAQARIALERVRQPLEASDTPATLADAVDAINTAIDRRNKDVASLNVLAAIINALPTGVHLAQYSPDTGNLTAEAQEQHALGETAIALDPLLHLRNPTTTLGTPATPKTAPLYPTITFSFDTAVTR